MKIYQLYESYLVSVGLDEPYERFNSEQEAISFLMSHPDKDYELVIEIKKRIRLN